MGLLKWTAILFVPVVIGVYIALHGCGRSPPILPNMADGWWGHGLEQDSDNSTVIRPIIVTISDDTLNDLRTRLLNARISESLQGEVNFEYGFHSAYMKEVVEYWLNKYSWREQEKLLNSYPQYMTNIEGIDVHFLHVKPSNPSGKVRALIITHGWPGSVWELYKIIPMLSSVNTGDLSLELIIPSIPGYGFSEAPHRRGFDVIDAARIFHKLMTRLGHDRYYVQGGDYGALISRFMGALYCSNVIGVHLNFAGAPMDSFPANLRMVIGAWFPSLIYKENEMVRYLSIKDQLSIVWREMGYMHFQSTRPDTVAYGLNDSPVGLAAYILEKFSVWTDYDNRFCADGCLTKHFTLDELLTNVMIYWVTGSIGSSVRFYKETFGGEDFHTAGRLPVSVPTGVASFPNEVFLTLETVVRSHLENVVHYTLMSQGGHFAAMELPEILAGDIVTFIELVEQTTATDPAV